MIFPTFILDNRSSRGKAPFYFFSKEDPKKRSGYLKVCVAECTCIIYGTTAKSFEIDVGNVRVLIAVKP